MKLMSDRSATCFKEFRQSAEAAQEKEGADLARLSVWHLSRGLFGIRQAMVSGDGDGDRKRKVMLNV